MSDRGEKRLTIAVLDNENRLVELRRNVPESQIGENAVVVPADIDLPLDGSYFWNSERQSFWPWRGPPMTTAERAIGEALARAAPSIDERMDPIDTWEDFDWYKDRTARAVKDAVDRRKSTENLAPGRNQRNTDAKFEARQHYAKWQHSANEIWRRRPSLSNEAVARHIKKADPSISAKPGTIAKKIKQQK